MRLVALPLITLFLTSCQTMHSDDPDSMAFNIPPGSTLTLNKSLEIADGETHAMIQAGRQISKKDKNEYDINCRLELREFGPRTIDPEVFIVSRTEDGQEWFSYPTIKRFYSEVYLRSENNTDVIKLMCQQWGSGRDRNFTVSEMQQALADYFSFTFTEK